MVSSIIFLAIIVAVIVSYRRKRGNKTQNPNVSAEAISTFSVERPVNDWDEISYDIDHRVHEHVQMPNFTGMHYKTSQIEKAGIKKSWENYELGDMGAPRHWSHENYNFIQAQAAEQRNVISNTTYEETHTNSGLRFQHSFSESTM